MIEKVRWIGTFKSSVYCIPLIGSWHVYGDIETFLPSLETFNKGDEAEGTLIMRYKGWYRTDVREDMKYKIKHNGESLEISDTFFKAMINYPYGGYGTSDCLYGTYQMSMPYDKGEIQIQRFIPCPSNSN